MAMAWRAGVITKKNWIRDKRTLSLSALHPYVLHLGTGISFSNFQC